MDQLPNSVLKKQLRSRSLYRIESLGSKTIKHTKVKDYKLVNLASVLRAPSVCLALWEIRMTPHCLSLPKPVNSLEKHVVNTVGTIFLFFFAVKRFSSHLFTMH